MRRRRDVSPFIIDVSLRTCHPFFIPLLLYVRIRSALTDPTDTSCCTIRQDSIAYMLEAVKLHRKRILVDFIPSSEPSSLP